MTSTPEPKKFILEGFNDQYKSESGIERAIFIDNVDNYKTVEQADQKLAELQDTYMKYNKMQIRLNNLRLNLKLKVPEIEKTLKAVEFLQKQHEKQQPTQTNFQLTDGVFVEGKIPETNSAVGIWLGANVIVEYNFQEAIELLKENKESSEKQLDVVEEDLSFVKDQLTTTEVNISRVYNRAVILEKAQKK